MCEYDLSVHVEVGWRSVWVTISSVKSSFDLSKFKLDSYLSHWQFSNEHSLWKNSNEIITKKLPTIASKCAIRQQLLSDPVKQHCLKDVERRVGQFDSKYFTFYSLYHTKRSKSWSEIDLKDIYHFHHRHALSKMIFDECYHWRNPRSNFAPISRCPDSTVALNFYQLLI